MKEKKKNLSSLDTHLCKVDYLSGASVRETDTAVEWCLVSYGFNMVAECCNMKMSILPQMVTLQVLTRFFTLLYDRNGISEQGEEKQPFSTHSAGMISYSSKEN